MYELQSPKSKITVRPGNIVKLNRFDDECWIVNLGWFSYAGNRPINGWYLVSKAYKDKVKPLNLSDLEDIYVIEAGEVKEDYKELDPEIKKLIHDLKVQVEELSREVAQLTAEVEAKDEVIAEKGEEILELQRQIRELQRQIEELESQHRLDAETIATLNSQVTAQAQIIAEKAAEIRELTARVAELAEENELLTQQHQEDLATIAQQASTIQAQAESIASLTDDNNRLTDENDRLTEENTELVAQHQEDTATIAQQQETISSQGEQITELSGEVTELTSENTRLEALTETQRETIQNMLDNPPQPQLYTPPEPIIPESETKVYTPPQNYDGFASFSVKGDKYLNVDLQKFLAREIDFDLEIKANPIGHYLCYSQTGLVNCVLSGRPTSIGANAFSGCYALQNINFPNSLITIGNSAFSGCYSIQTINLPNGLTTIGTSSFSNCGVINLYLPNSLTTIGNQSFSYCSNLINIIIEHGFNCNGLNISYSTLYSTETIVSWLEALADRTGQTAYTLTIGTTNLNKLTAEQKAIATNKNWNLA